MKLLRFDQPNFEQTLAQEIAASSLFDATIEARVRDVIAAVRERGDAALVELTERFDHVRLTDLRVKTRVAPPPADLRRAIAVAHRNVAEFAKRSLRKDWQMRNAQGGIVGEKFDPIGRVGIYVPGGTAPLVSTVIMTVTLAKVAGCKEIVVCSPPPINPALRYAAQVAGATELYQIGGAQAIAALALGTPTIKRVAKIYGPGNAYVTAAKRLLFGVVGIDMLSGPSELLVLADGSADPRYIAADMLAQAEHGSGYERVWLVTTSAQIATATAAEYDRQLAALSRRDFVAKITPVIVVAKTLKQAVVIANQFAPEHCEIMTTKSRQVLRQITTAGAVFLGPWTPTVVGDYVAGPSHALPTGGAGAWFAGLTVDQFQRRTSVVEFTKQALQKSWPALAAFGGVEGLDAHVKSAQIRASK